MPSAWGGKRDSQKNLEESTEKIEIKNTTVPEKLKQVNIMLETMSPFS